MKYLNTNFGFEQEIINIYFDKPLRKALSSENLFKKTPIIISCFFQFTQAIIYKNEKIKYYKKKIN